MRKGEKGQAFILVLILLAIGALIIVPALKLTGTSLKGSQIVSRYVGSLYAADGAQEYVLWKLSYDGYGAEFTTDNESKNFPVDVCGTSVNVTVVMRAVEGKGGITLATEHVIKPTKTVLPASSLTSPLPDGSSRTYTYTIRLEQLSDNTSQGLDAVYDVLPKGLTYVPGTSKLRVDGGAWVDFPSYSSVTVLGQVRLRWPSSGSFASPMRDFAVRQVKEIQFQASGSLTPNNAIHANWVVLKPWDTLSGPQAGIYVGTPPSPWYYNADGLLEVDKTSNPEVIQPRVEAEIEYTISVTNRDGATRQLQGITDYLPPGFIYTDNSTGGDITSSNPQGDPPPIETLNGLERQVLRWTDAEFPGGQVSIDKGGTRVLTFRAWTTKDVSGSYYNEVQIRPNVPVPKIVYEIIGPTTAEDPEDREAWNTTYSWNTGTVIVPAYDSRADADDVYIDANMALILGGISITSWQIY